MGAYVAVAPVDPEDARTAQEPAQNGHLHQLLFGHDPDGGLFRYGETDHQRVQVGEVVGADEDFALGDIFRVNFSEREQEHEQRFHEAVEVAIALVHTLVGVLLFLLVCHGSNPLPDGLQEQLVALLQVTFGGVHQHRVLCLAQGCDVPVGVVVIPLLDVLQHLLQGDGVALSWSSSQRRLARASAEAVR